MRKVAPHFIDALTREHDACGVATADLDGMGEDRGIVEALSQGRDGHHLRNGAEAEDGVVPQPPHVLQAPRCVVQGVPYQLVEALHRLRALLLLQKLTQAISVLAPCLLGPPHPRFWLLLMAQNKESDELSGREGGRE